MLSQLTETTGRTNSQQHYICSFGPYERQYKSAKSSKPQGETHHGTLAGNPPRLAVNDAGRAPLFPWPPLLWRAPWSMSWPQRTSTLFLSLSLSLLPLLLSWIGWPAGLQVHDVIEIASQCFTQLQASPGENSAPLALRTKINTLSLSLSHPPSLLPSLSPFIPTYTESHPSQSCCTVAFASLGSSTCGFHLCKLCCTSHCGALARAQRRRPRAPLALT